MHSSLTKADSAIIRGNLDVAYQAQQLLASVTNEAYSRMQADGFTSTIGQHMRHALDMYWALHQGEGSGVMDADERRRGHRVETDKSLAQAEWQAIASWLHTLSEQQLKQSINVSTQVTLYASNTVTTPSTIMRELIAVASHATHHFAMMRTAAHDLGEVLDKEIGIAAATASYQREQHQCAR
ncbi:hypothetical protein [Salinivibrio kushneri]|uniref:hypothetical protein n=1 Tax=Salinivibrio kushneri TaxID=1908198 RepID=UPI000989647E|nr:hypothetical protein [Salinivibrio kushneri]OOE70137.1 hypothetical protein BZG19_06390 [Salinivibrio kushneri]WBA13312.1 DinB family protein [Salinivibrio kushneri]